jgi:hypothetical protein
MKMRMTPLACLLAPLLSACGGGGSDEAPLTAPDYRLTVTVHREDVDNNSSGSG